MVLPSSIPAYRGCPGPVAVKRVFVCLYHSLSLKLRPTSNSFNPGTLRTAQAALTAKTPACVIVKATHRRQ